MMMLGVKDEGEEEKEDDEEEDGRLNHRFVALVNSNVHVSGMGFRSVTNSLCPPIKNQHLQIANVLLLRLNDNILLNF